MSESAKPEPHPFEKLRQVTREILSVSKQEIDRRAEEWRKGREAKKRGK